MPDHPATRSNSRRGALRGFTLIETAIATIIIGVGVLALLEAQQSFLQKNSWSTNASTATFLANEIREMTRHFTRHDEFSGGIYFDDPIAMIGLRGWGPEALELSSSDFDDLDDLDGVAFGDAPNLPGPLVARMPGPINSFAEIIPNVTWMGDVTTDAQQNIDPLAGWTQYVRVEKVVPGDFTNVVTDDFVQAGPPFVAVDEFPLRVTVHVLYQGPFEVDAVELARVVWIVPD